MRRLLVTTIVATMALGLVATPARAAAPRDQGWWTATSAGVPGTPVSVPPPPDVPARGLLVQAGPGGAPTAYSALLYELDQGMTATTLTLAVAPNSLTTPRATVQLCPLLQPINHPEQGGPLSDAPPYNCAKNVPAAPGPDGKTYKFDVSGLRTDNLVAFAILPAGPLDRVVFNAPDDSSLTTQQGSSSDAASGFGTDTSGSVPAIGSDFGAGSAPVGGALGISSAPAVSVGESPIASPAPAVPPRASTGTGPLPFIPAGSAAPEKATPILVILFVAGALGGAALWLYAGRRSDDDLAVTG